MGGNLDGRRLELLAARTDGIGPGKHQGDVVLLSKACKRWHGKRRRTHENYAHRWFQSFGSNLWTMRELLGVAGLGAAVQRFLIGP